MTSKPIGKPIGEPTGEVAGKMTGDVTGKPIGKPTGEAESASEVILAPAKLTLSLRITRRSSVESISPKRCTRL